MIDNYSDKIAVIVEADKAVYNDVKTSYEDVNRFEFTCAEVCSLVAALVMAQYDNEQYLKTFGKCGELSDSLKKQNAIFTAILNKLRHPA